MSFTMIEALQSANSGLFTGSVTHGPEVTPAAITPTRADQMQRGRSFDSSGNLQLNRDGWVTVCVQPQLDDRRSRKSRPANAIFAVAEWPAGFIADSHNVLNRWVKAKYCSVT